MDHEYVKSYRGSPRPNDVFQPHMPDVDLLSNMDAFFAEERSKLLLANPPLDDQEKGQRYICVITPERSCYYIPCSPPDTMSSEELEPVTQLLPPDKPLNICAISYNFNEALMRDVTDANAEIERFMKNMGKCIPFFGFLLAFGYIGHNVIVFEGHPSAFESGVRASDLLLIDSAMLPFLQADWEDIADKVMNPEWKILIHNREDYTLSQVFKPDDKAESSKGWKKWWNLW